MKIYSQEEGTKFGWKATGTAPYSLYDYTVNGKFCTSGLAYPISDHEARCTTMDHMKFDGKKLTDKTFACDPTDQKKQCQLFFKINPADTPTTAKELLYVPNRCNCALDGGEKTGYCSA